MSYAKQNFKPGDVLLASQLNAMDDQIALNEAASKDFITSAGEYAAAAAASAAAAKTSEEAAEAAAEVASNSALEASDSEVAANNSATAASLSAQGAYVSAAAADASETAAATSAQNAAASASAAAQSAQDAEDVLDSIVGQFVERVETTVDNWLDDHPEASTTVQDHSLTFEKLVNGTLGYVTPEMFGAKGDGVNDDTESIQMAIDFAFDRGYIVQFSEKNYLITRPLIVWARYNHAPVRKNIVGGGRIIGAGIGKTYITKAGNQSSGITGQDIKCIVQVVDERYRNSDFSAADNETACYDVYIDGLSLQNDEEDNTVHTNDYGIFSVGFFFSEFRNISIIGCGSGIGTRRWNCGCKYQFIDINFADVGFNFGLSLVGSGGQTAALFVNCHTNGCSLYAYVLAMKATLINCSNDGGTATFIYGPDSPGVADRQGINATIINCHCESLTANGLFKIFDGHVTVFGGYYELPDDNDSTIVIAKKQATVEINNAYIVSRQNKTDIDNVLYEVSGFAVVHFNKCFFNNTIFGNPLPLKSMTYSAFDCGLDQTTLIKSDNDILVTVDSAMDIDVETPINGERTLFLYLGEINTNLYNNMRLYTETDFSDGFCAYQLVLATSLDSAGKPAAGSYAVYPLAYNASWTKVDFSSRTRRLGWTKNMLTGTDMPQVGVKHMFIRLFVSGQSDTDTGIGRAHSKIYKILLQ